MAKQLATSAPKNIPDWVLLQTFLGIFRCSKDKMAVHFYLKTILDHSLSPVRNKINISLGMEANTQRFCCNSYLTAFVKKMLDARLISQLSHIHPGAAIDLMCGLISRKVSSDYNH